jgi:signal transduction histidine kinase/CheY-like chemotaxis protein
MRSWRIVLVDDDHDVHTAINGLTGKEWDGRPLRFVSAYTKEEAIELLASGASYQAVIIGLTMGAKTPGLELCEFIRQSCSNSTRIVLYPARADGIVEEDLLKEYDIDYCAAKTDTTPERLFPLIYASIRHSERIATLVAYGKQLQGFTKCLQERTISPGDLIIFMAEALRFLGRKHNCGIFFGYDLSQWNRSYISEEVNAQAWSGFDPETAAAAIAKAHELSLTSLQVHSGTGLGLPGTSVIPFEARNEHASGPDHMPPYALGGLIFESPDESTIQAQRNFLADATPFLENWCIAFSTLRLRERVVHEQLLREQMYQDRMESITRMVTGVAHQLNTPLGVAQTAGSIMDETVGSLLSLASLDPRDVEEFKSDLQAACHLLNKNLCRAERLILRFKQLSASQLSDQYAATDLEVVIRDCVESMGSSLSEARIKVDVRVADNIDCRWSGYPGHLAQVINNLMQNVIHHAYDQETGGIIEISISRRIGGDRFRVEVADFGKGVEDSIKSRMFDAFVTYGRNNGGAGLGLGIVQNIMENLLGGKIICDSRVGKGARFVLELPAVCEVSAPRRRNRSD